MRSRHSQPAGHLRHVQCSVPGENWLFRWNHSWRCSHFKVSENFFAHWFFFVQSLPVTLKIKCKKNEKKIQTYTYIWMYEDASNWLIKAKWKWNLKCSMSSKREKAGQTFHPNSGLKYMQWWNSASDVCCSFCAMLPRWAACGGLLKIFN